jgi:Holliday junction resolvase RusA-like endonuclease
MIQSLADELLGPVPGRFRVTIAADPIEHSLGILRFTILGEPASKANSRKAVFVGKGDARRMLWIKSEKARTYERDAARQIRKLPQLLTGPLAVTMTIHYASERPDLDPSLILDAMQGRIYANDRQVRELHCYHAIDAANPRAEIQVKPLSAQQPPLL